MTISIPTKSEKTIATLKDAFRILAWQFYKSSNKDLKDANGEPIKGLELYDIFKAEWLKHKVHKMDLPQLLKFIEEMGYSEEELLNIRSEHYQNQADYKKQQQRTQSTESKLNQLKQKYSESESDETGAPF